MGCRWLVCAAVALVGCTNSPSSTTATTMQSTTTTTLQPHHVDLHGLQFDLAPELRYQADGWVSTMEAVDSFYSNVQLGQACHVVGNGGSCGSPLTTLPEGAVLVSWGSASGLITSQSTVPNTTLAGQPATMTIDKPGTCFGMPTDETITVLTPQSGGSGSYKMQACMRAPNVAASEQLVRAMLDSVTIG